MRIHDARGGEAGAADSSLVDPEGVQHIGTYGAGALVPGKLGNYHYVLSGTDTTGNIASAIKSNATQTGGAGMLFVGDWIVRMIDLKLTAVPATTQKDVWVVQHKPTDASNGYGVKYTGASDSPGKLRFYVQNTEVDSASAPDYQDDVPFTLMLKFKQVSPYTVELYIDWHDGNGWQAYQSGTASAAINPSPNDVMVGQALGKGNATNIAILWDNYSVRSDYTGIAELPDIALDDYIEIVAYVPSADGANNAWTDDTGTACGSDNCYIEVDDIPANTADYVTVTQSTGNHNQDFETTDNGDALDTGLDTIAAVRVGGRETATDVTKAAWRYGNSNNIGASDVWATSGSGYTRLSDLNPVDASTLTVAGVRDAEIGAALNASGGSVTLTVINVIKFVAFVRAPASGGADRRRRLGQVV